MRSYKIAILALGLLLSAGQALACSCAPAQSAAEQAESYPLIFVGTAVSSVDVTPAAPPVERTFWQRLQFWKPAPPPPQYRIQSFETVFQVSRVLKGIETEMITLTHIGNNGALCGRDFLLGDEYLILANVRADGKFTTGLCGLPQFSLAEFEAALAPTDTPVVGKGTVSDDITNLYGTWGKDEAQCAIFQEERGAPFILTASSFDQHETHCDVSYVAASPTGWNMKMSCSVEGDLQELEEWVSVADGTLLRSFDGGITAQEFIRCSDQ